MYFEILKYYRLKIELTVMALTIMNVEKEISTGN